MHHHARRQTGRRPAEPDRVPEPGGEAEFDTVVDRFGTDSAKWDGARAAYGDGVIALSVADMDIPAPASVTAAVTERARSGLYGYTDLPDDHFAAVRDWLAERHGWAPDPGHLLYASRIVEAVPLMLRLWTAPGDGVLVHTPGYQPLREAVTSNGRRVVESPLRYREGRYEMDFDQMAAAVTEQGVTATLLCSPHNPTGRVWSRAELERFAEFAVRHDLLVVSDDVHADFTGPAFTEDRGPHGRGGSRPHGSPPRGTADAPPLRGRPHTFLASLGKDIAARTVTATSPGKTFNLAGLEIATLIVDDPERRTRLAAALRAAGLHNPTFFAAAALRAGYREGAWLDRLGGYLTGNLALLRDTVAEELPAVRMVEPEGTYLAWLDLSRLRAAADDAAAEAEPAETIARRAGVVLSAGSSFGAAYRDFARINLATPRPLLAEALDRLTRPHTAPAGGAAFTHSATLPTDDVRKGV